MNIYRYIAISKFSSFLRIPSGSFLGAEVWCLPNWTSRILLIRNDLRFKFYLCTRTHTETDSKVILHFCTFFRIMADITASICIAYEINGLVCCLIHVLMSWKMIIGQKLVEKWVRERRRQSLRLRSEWTSWILFSLAPFATTVTASSAACKFSFNPLSPLCIYLLRKALSSICSRMC